MKSRTIRIVVVLLSLAAMTFSFTCYICTNNNIVTYAQTLTPSSPPTDSGYPTIQIVSPHDSQLVPPGELTIQGISSDNEETDCQVYADVNDITPMRDVAAAGDSGEAEDFSKWTFTYTQNYQLIKEGENELTAKISCVDDQTFDLNPFPASTASSSSSPLSEWHTINVTGTAGSPSIPLPLPTVGNTEGLAEEGEDDNDGENNEEENDEIEEDDDSDNDSNGDEDDDSNNEEEEEDTNEVDGSENDEEGIDEGTIDETDTPESPELTL
jgi:hypothetical protein